MLNDRLRSIQRTAANVSSPILFSSSASTRALFRDHLMARSKRLSRVSTLPILYGVLPEKDVQSLPTFDASRTNDRTHNRSGLSLGYTIDAVPGPVDVLVSSVRSYIEGFLGRGFLYEKPLIWRNYPLPAEVAGYDVYSNVWHQDPHDGDRLLKVFVLLTDTYEGDGPLEFLTPSDTQRVYHTEFQSRYSVGTIGKVRDLTGAQKLTGPRGSYAIVNTAASLHRAGNPTSHRDMLQLVLLPPWRKREGRKVYPRP